MIGCHSDPISASGGQNISVLRSTCLVMPMKLDHGLWQAICGHPFTQAGHFGAKALVCSYRNVKEKGREESGMMLSSG